MSIARRRRNLPRKLPIRAIGIGLLVGIVVIAGCLVAPKRSYRATRDGEPVVRVRVLSNVPSVDLIIDGSARTIAASSVRDATTIEPKSNEYVSIAGRRYRGAVTIVPVEGNSIDVINLLSVDDYLAGVVPREAFASWPMDALKAQAIAARTYAIYQLRTRPDSDRTYDLNADVRSQAYGGVDDEKPTSSQAVEETRGIVLAYGPRHNEKIFCAYYSAVCGGLTASGQDVFDDSTPTLKEHPSDGCSEAPRYRWPEISIRKDELTRRVKVWGQRNKMNIANMARLRSIDVIQRNAVGRPSRFVVTDETGKRFALDAEQMRNACNAEGTKDTQVLSSFFTPIETKDAIRFTDGRGWGHGVGFCQWCAAGLSKKGMKYGQILKTAYPGAVLVKAY